MSSSKVRRFQHPAKFKKLVILHVEENGNREAARNAMKKYQQNPLLMNQILTA